MTIISKLIAPNARPRRTRKPGLNVYHAIAEMAGGLGRYLNVTSRTAIAGREIQNLEAEIIINERVNADLQTDIATLLSNNILEKRALADGFIPFETTDLEYLVVPGYFPSQGVNMITPAADTDVLAASPEYSESLFSWVARQMEAASAPLAQVR
jgi:hypothetical protein